MYSYEINQSDTWIFYEKCGDSLGSNLYDIKSEKVYGDQRLYKVFFSIFSDILQTFLPINGIWSKSFKETNYWNLQTFGSAQLMWNCPFRFENLKYSDQILTFKFYEGVQTDWSKTHWLWFKFLV